MFFVPTEIWMIVVPIAIIWFVVQGMKGVGKSVGSYHSGHIQLRNMNHGDSPIKVVSAYRSETGMYCANMWMPNIKKCVTISAKTKEELEELVDREYREYEEYQ